MIKILQGIWSFFKNIHPIEEVSLDFSIKFTKSDDLHDNRIHFSNLEAILVSVLMNKRDYLAHYVRSFYEESEFILTQKPMAGQKMMPLIHISYISKIVKHQT